MSDAPLQVELTREGREGERRRNERLLQAIFEHAAVGIEIFDRDGVSQRMNQAQSRLFGLPSVDAVSGRFNVRTDPVAISSGAAEHFERALRGESVPPWDQVLNLPATGPDGSLVVREVVLNRLFFAVHDEQGEIDAVVALAWDTTARAKAERALRETESRLWQILEALPVGVLAAVKPYSWFDRIASTLAFVGFSLPTFFTGVLFILFFSIYLGWFPFVYRSDISATGWMFFWEHFKQSIMPIMVLGLFQAASWMRYVRSAVLDVIRLDYVTTARSKGLKESEVINKHVVRNAMIPVVTLIALQLPQLFGGAIVTEQIFRIPGIGSLLIDAILRNDTPVIMAVTFVFAMFLPRIAETLGLPPDRILFLSDIEAELDAARTAGLATCLLARGGEMTSPHPIARDFHHIAQLQEVAP